MRRRPAAGLVLAMLLPGRLAASPAPSNSNGWFVPPPPAKSSLAGAGTHMDTQDFGSVENITVTAAKRPIQRDPHPEELHDYNPHRSEAGAPEQGNAGQGACSNAAYNTIGGQPATGMDMISMGGGRCN